MDDLLREFLTEAGEGLAVLDVELVKLEQTPDDPTLLGSIFRIVHTIKGTCGFLALPRLEKVAHASENVLGKYRDGEIEVTPDSITLILESLDAIKLILSVIEETEAEPEGDDADLIARLNLAAEGKTADAGEPAAEPSIEDVMAADGDTAEADEPVKAEAADDAPEEEAPAEAVKAEKAKESKPETKPKSAKKTAPPATEKPATDKGAKRPESAIAAQSIRVHVDLLEDLMTMVSELVLTRNQLLQIMRGREDAELAAPLQRINQVTSELQEGVMKTRMQPIGNAWAKLPRIVRDLGLELNKKFDLQMIGEDTELDRQILELIRDPLTHMVRNSCDHGIGTPEERAADGKPEVGKIILDAHHEGGHIIVRISDDGRGLPLDMIKTKALDNDIVTEAQLATMTDQQIQQLIFSAGLSTAEQVTNVSGRGVGMDVVKTNIEKIGGNIEMLSVEGKGTTFTIKIPLTLAIVNALIVEVAGERFAIPQISVTELVRASAESEHRLEHINGVPVLRLRDRLLPLVSLRKLMNLDNDENAPVSGSDEKGSEADDQSQSAGNDAAVPADKTARDNKETFIVVCHAGTFAFGIIVDRVFDTEEIVVKPVAPILRNLTLFSGNTILGDGSVIMILDPNGILAAAGEIIAAESEETESKPGAATGSGERVALLLFRAGGSIPKAVPLALVARLEEFDAEKIEHTNGRSVVQYRDQLMPLITVDRDSSVKSEDRQPVIVFSDRDRSMGIVVDEIVDIVEEVLSVELPAQPGSGLLGSAIIAEQATDIIDVAYYLTEAFDDWFGVDDGSSHQAGPGARSVLLVDDSPFFRNLLTPLLSVAGYQVTTAESGDVAMDMCKSGAKFDIIVSDIEMPGMNGFEFAEAVRSTPEWEGTPLVALSSLASPEDLERGRAAGFSDYVAKFDRDALLQSLAQSLTADRGAA